MDAGDGVFDPVAAKLAVGHLEEDDRVDLHGDVVFGDDLLRREVVDLLLPGDLLGDPAENGENVMDAGGRGAGAFPQCLDDAFLGLADRLYPRQEEDDQEKRDARNTTAMGSIEVPPYSSSV